MSLNPSRIKALKMLEVGPMDKCQIILNRFQERTFEALCDMGYAKFRPNGNPPTWAITPEGRYALASLKKIGKDRK